MISHRRRNAAARAIDPENKALSCAPTFLTAHLHDKPGVGFWSRRPECQSRLNSDRGKRRRSSHSPTFAILVPTPGCESPSPRLAMITAKRSARRCVVLAQLQLAISFPEPKYPPAAISGQLRLHRSSLGGACHGTPVTPSGRARLVMTVPLGIPCVASMTIGIVVSCLSAATHLVITPVNTSGRRDTQFAREYRKLHWFACRGLLCAAARKSTRHRVSAGE